MSGRLQLPTDFKVHPGENSKSAVTAISNSETELKNMLRGSKSGNMPSALVKKKKKGKRKSKN